MRVAALTASLALLLPQLAGRADEAFQPRTRLSLSSGFWKLNGKPAHAGSRAEGLLMNARMVNATFEDRNPATCPPGFDPDRNTEAFLKALPDYLEHGILAFTLCLQGGMPGYVGALNSAYEPDGSLRPGYLRRVERVIEECDRRGAAVILGCFYQRQDQVLRDEAAVRRAVVETASWLKRRGYTNVALEIANEHRHDGFDHEVIKDPAGCASLIELARETHPGLLVSASGMGNGRLDYQVDDASDFLLLHFNSVPVSLIPQRVASNTKSSKAVVCNEDDKTGEEAAAAAEAAVKSLCSWGYMNSRKNQYYPFEFEGAADDPILYAKLRELTSPKRAAEELRPEVRRIWDAGKHNAFTDLARHRGEWFCVFREGEAHVSPDGAVRIIRSPDGDSWRSAAFITRDGWDLRDPKLCAAPGGRLMLLAGAAKRQGSNQATEHWSLVAFSEDGESWSELREVAERNLWLWRVTWHGKLAYGVAYGSQLPDGSRAPRPFTRLFKSGDGVEFETLVPLLHDEGYPNEARLLFFDDGGALCLLRRDGASRSALLGRSRPPYTEWSWKDLEVHLGGPNCLLLPGGRIVAAGRFVEGGTRTALAWLDPEKGRLEKFLELPSGGDTSYPGLVHHEGTLWVSYYSSHEGKTSIYLAKVKLP
jgi:hypothetical protein